MAQSFQESALPPLSKLVTLPTPRMDMKEATTPRTVIVSAISPVTSSHASSLVAGQAKPDYASKQADFYRDGQVQAGSYESGQALAYATPPRKYDGWEYDEKIASIRLFGFVGSGEAGSRGVRQDLLPAYTKFFLENVQEGHAEKTQVVETFGKFYIYSFGERPPMYTFSGRLMSTKNADWSSDFAFLYDNYLRSTKAAASDAKVIITYGGKQVEGAVVSLTTSRQADVDGAVPFQIQLIVYDKKYLNFSKDFGLSTQDGKNLAKAKDFERLVAEVTGGKSGTGTSNPQVSAVTKRTEDVVNNKAPAMGPITKEEAQKVWRAPLIYPQ